MGYSIFCQHSALLRYWAGLGDGRSAAVQFEQGNLRRTAITNWENDRSEPPRDVNLGVAVSPETVQNPTSSPASRVTFRPERNLTTMGMSAQNQIDALTRSTAQDDWIMSEQKLHFAGAAASQSEREILEPDHCVVDSG